MILITSRNTKNIYNKNEDTLICIDKWGFKTKSYIKRSQSTSTSSPLQRFQNTDSGATFSTPAFYPMFSVGLPVLVTFILPIYYILLILLLISPTLFRTVPSPIPIRPSLPEDWLLQPTVRSYTVRRTQYNRLSQQQLSFLLNNDAICRLQKWMRTADWHTFFGGELASPELRRFQLCRSQ